MKTSIFALIQILFFVNTAFASLGLDGIPVQDGGRVKPFDSFARERLQLTYGREKYKGRKATHILLSWMLISKEWDQIEFIQIRHSGLREALGLDKIRTHYSPDELMVNDKIGILVSELRTKTERKDKLNPFFQAVQTLEAQLSSYNGIKTGFMLRVVPKKEGSTWEVAARVSEPHRQNFAAIGEAFLQVAQAEATKGDVKNATKALDKAANAFVAGVQAEFGKNYVEFDKINAELKFFQLHPFMYAWIFYLLATVLFAVGFSRESKGFQKFAWGALALGFIFNTVGFSLRVYVTGRPPVSNMYETVVWVSWGAVFIAAVLYKFFGNRIILPASTFGATFGLILSDLSPQVLDKSMAPLEAVLRDNFWLLTHVLTITLSYAGFFIAFVIGDVVLWYYLKDEKKYAKNIQAGCQAMYRSIQVGVILIAAGVILGGIWADYSWGRFWGWDPKETWALIALLGYLAILHGRLVGWVKNFALAVTSVLAFSLVIMAWYGVNFVLGAGLHTYGFGAGGVEYVSVFVAIHVLYVIFVSTVRQSRQH